uniref:Uncharacterized protein n=1 Tax=Anguilla anguilla TaxID=7936 RepID=A0A0E9XXI6_ANGAN
MQGGNRKIGAGAVPQEDLGLGGCLPCGLGESVVGRGQGVE